MREVIRRRWRCPAELRDLHVGEPELRRAASRSVSSWGASRWPRPSTRRAEGVDRQPRPRRGGAVRAALGLGIGHEVQDRELPEPDGVVGDDVGRPGRCQLGPGPQHLRDLLGLGSSPDDGSSSDATPNSAPRVRRRLRRRVGFGLVGGGARLRVSTVLLTLVSFQDQSGKWDARSVTPRRPHLATRAFGCVRVRISGRHQRSRSCRAGHGHGGHFQVSAIFAPNRPHRSQQQIEEALFDEAVTDSHTRGPDQRPHPSPRGVPRGCGRGAARREAPPGSARTSP